MVCQVNADCKCNGQWAVSDNRVIGYDDKDREVTHRYCLHCYGHSSGTFEFGPVPVEPRPMHKFDNVS